MRESERSAGIDSGFMRSGDLFTSIKEATFPKWHRVRAQIMPVRGSGDRNASILFDLTKVFWARPQVLSRWNAG